MEKTAKAIASIYRPDLVQDEQKLRMADVVFGEGGPNISNTVKTMIASSMLNRLNDKRHDYGRTIDAVINKPGAYYAVHDKDPIAKNPFKEAATMQFGNEARAKKFGQIQDIVDEVYNDPSKRTKGTHFFKDWEALDLKPKMRLIRSNVGPYDVYSDY